MSSIFNNLLKRNLITPPKFLENSIQYEVRVGSVSYGVSSDNSDIDVLGFSIPPKEIIFPHLSGYIIGFGQQPKKFEQFQKHHIFDNTDNKIYDITIYNIVKYFQLCMDNNPNMIDSLFVPDYCVIYSSEIGNLVRENKNLFLHKGSWFKFKGYAYSQLHKMDIKKANPESKRYESIVKYGYDIKFAYHIVRLLDECQQILEFGDLDLQRNREQLKSIRRGEWTKEEIRNYFFNQEKKLEDIYNKSKIPKSPPVDKLKNLLLNCLEIYYGSLKEII